MIKRLITLFLKRRHFWRYASFDELSELYTNALLRSLANSLIGIFVPVFLYRLGYSLQTIFGMYVFWFAVRPVLDVLNAFIVGRIGPKHSLALASLLNIGYLALLLSLQSLHWPLLFVAFFGSWATGLHLQSFHTDFSKVKHSEHGGKELSYIAVLERIGGVIGPLVGGVIATVYDPRYTIAAAIFLQIVALIPLFMSAEPVVTKQHITFKGMAWRRHIPDYVSTVPLSVENFISAIIWPLFLTAVVLGSAVFAKLGIIVAAGTGLTILAAQLIGRLIDDSKGGLLLRVGTVVNAAIHCVRPFITSFPAAIGINIANDPVTAAYQMPYMKGFYDAADSLPGYRIAYIASIQVVGDIAKTLLCLGLWLATNYTDPVTVIKVGFFVAALASLGIMTERFPALRRAL